MVENELIKFKWMDTHVCFNFRAMENERTEVTIDFATTANDQDGLNGFMDEIEGWGEFLMRLKLYIERGFIVEDYR